MDRSNKLNCKLKTSSKGFVARKEKSGWTENIKVELGIN
jgi:hypothetical protein